MLLSPFFFFLKGKKLPAKTRPIKQTVKKPSVSRTKREAKAAIKVLTEPPPDESKGLSYSTL